MTETIAQEQETVSQVQETLDWLSHIGNDERKLLVLLTLWQSQQPLGSSGVLNEMERLAGDSLQTRSSRVGEYIEDNFHKVNAVTSRPEAIVRRDGHQPAMPMYDLTDRARAFGVPLAGALLGWSFRHPEMALKQVFCTSKGDASAQSPLRRYYLLYDLVTLPGNPKGPSATQIAKDYEVGVYRNNLTAIDRLADFGWVKKSTTAQENTRQFRILDPQYKEGHGKRHFHSLKPETQLTYNALGQAHTLKDVWGVDEFFTFLNGLYPDADPSVLYKAKKNIRHSLSPNTTTFNGTIEDFAGKPYDDAGKVELEVQVSAAVQELISIIDGFCSGDVGMMNRGMASAQEIVTSPDEFSTLYGKATEVSNYANSDPEIDKRLQAIVEGAGAFLTSHVIRDIYFEVTGRNVTEGVIEEALAKLVKEGRIVQGVGHKEKYDRRKVSRFGSVAIS